MRVLIIGILMFFTANVLNAADYKQLSAIESDSPSSKASKSVQSPLSAAPAKHQSAKFKLLSGVLPAGYVGSAGSIQEPTPKQSSLREAPNNKKSCGKACTDCFTGCYDRVTKRLCCIALDCCSTGICSTYLPCTTPTSIGAASIIQCCCWSWTCGHCDWFLFKQPCIDTAGCSAGYCHHSCCNCHCCSCCSCDCCCCGYDQFN